MDVLVEVVAFFTVQCAYTVVSPVNTVEVLIMNPPFTRYLLRLLGAEPEELPFEAEAMEAYRRRLADFH